MNVPIILVKISNLSRDYCSAASNNMLGWLRTRPTAYFTAPLVRPCIIRLWKTRAINTIGMQETTDAAMIYPQGNSPCSPWKSAMPTGTVLAAWSVVSISAKRNSLNENMKSKSTVERKPGKAMGMITWTSTFNLLAPSTRAALSMSCGSCEK